MAQLKGADRCRKLVRMKLGQLQMATVKKQQKMFMDLLPDYLNNVLPDVGLDDTLETCTAKIQDHPRFSECFADVNRWEEDRDFLVRCSRQVRAFSEKGKEVYMIAIEIGGWQALSVAVAVVNFQATYTPVYYLFSIHSVSIDSVFQ